MLAIRMQRTGRKGHAMFRVVVQDSRLAPTSGRVVALLGSYDPHVKAVSLNKEKTVTYLSNGAQPSERVARLLKSEGVKLPKWVTLPGEKTGKIRNPDKLRKNRPAEPEPEKPAEEPAAAEPQNESTEEAPAKPQEEAVPEDAAEDDKKAQKDTTE